MTLVIFQRNQATEVATTSPQFNIDRLLATCESYPELQPIESAPYVNQAAQSDIVVHSFTYGMLCHHLRKLLKKFQGIVRAGGRLGMVLNAKNRFGLVA